MCKINKSIEMFISFFKIGAFTFGGGYAMVPLIEKEFVENKKWISKEDFLDILSLSQSFPGALAVNTSTFVGYRISGVMGAIMALLGSILPAFAVVLIIVAFLSGFRNNLYVNLVFKGINAAVPILVLVGVFSLAKAVKKTFINIVITILTVIAVAYFNISPIIVIILSGIFGYFYYRGKVE